MVLRFGQKLPALAILIVGLHSAVIFAQVEETIVVVGTRSERSIDEVAASVSLRTSEDIERELARDIADLVRFEPGVTVGGTGSRFGLGGFNIRGIEGNRVLTLVDGVRVSDEFSFGPFLSARRDFVDIDSLSRAEIARGPISSLYGSDALGGVVAFTTKRPRDYLTEGDDTHLGAKLGYSSADSSVVGSITAAVGFDGVSALLLYTYRDGDETETSGGAGGFGPGREDADPQSIDTGNLVAKVAITLAEGHVLHLGIDGYENETNTKIFSDYGTVARGTLVNSRDAKDEKDRTRYSITYEHTGNSVFADDASLTIYQQESETQQLTLESRTPPGRANQFRRRDSIFEQEINGAVLQVGKAFDMSGATHFVTYGVDYYETDNESMRDGGSSDAATGAPIFEFFPLPTRDFPSTEVTQLAFFLQDEIDLLGGRLLLSPGFRYDRYDADVTADAIYRSGNPGIPDPVDFDDSEVTAKIGVVYKINDDVSLFAQYSEGFRAPPYDDVNVGFTNFIGGYKTISNPNLKSETSEGWELGLRFQGEYGFITINAFKNEYENFIESLTIAPQFAPTFGIDPSDGLLTFQSVNLSEVEIDGVELSAELDLGYVFGAEGLTFKAAIAYADGENKTSSEAINSIEPLTAVLGFGYDAGSGKWGGDLVWTLVEGKDDSDIDSGNPRISTSGYGTLDLMGYYNFSGKISLNLGIFNITDKNYIRWADTVSIGNDASERFAQPGVNASATVRIQI